MSTWIGHVDIFYIHEDIYMNNNQSDTLLDRLKANSPLSRLLSDVPFSTFNLEKIEEFESRLLEVLTAYLENVRLPDARLSDEYEPLRACVSEIIANVSSYIVDGHVTGSKSIDHLRLVVQTIRSIQAHKGSHEDLEAAVSLMRDLNRYRNFRYSYSRYPELYTD